MRVPSRLEPLVDQGVIDEVIRPLMSGKEADTFLVLAHGEQRVAKVYKEASQRSFKHRAEYTEGRAVRDSRRQRAMGSGSKFGREQVEDAWRSAEVDAIYRLRAAGVTVPEPYDYVDGVLIMELVAGPDGEPAPRLVDKHLDADDARRIFKRALREVVRMLCAGLVHGDLSDFNILMRGDDPVIIDFPQAVDAAANLNARKLLLRDVRNLSHFLGKYVPDLKKARYGEEMWAMYERNELTPESKLTGKFKDATRKADTAALLDEIADAVRDEARRREALGLPPPRPVRPPVPAREAAPRPVPPARSAQAPRSEPRGRGDHAPRAPQAERTKPQAAVERRDRRSAEPRRAAPERADTASALDDLDAFLLVDET